MPSANRIWPVILVSKGLRSEARRRYEHSLSVNPDLQIAHKELADILCGDGEYDLAIAHYEEALRIQPDFKEAKQNLAFTRTLVGHRADANCGVAVDLERPPETSARAAIFAVLAGITGAAYAYPYGSHRHTAVRFQEDLYPGGRSPLPHLRNLLRRFAFHDLAFEAAWSSADAHQTRFPFARQCPLLRIIFRRGLSAVGLKLIP